MGKRKEQKELQKLQEKERKDEHRADLGKTVWGAVMLIGLGLLLLLRPDFGTDAVAMVVGWAMIAVGAIGVLVAVLSWPAMGLLQIVLGVGVTGFGIFILLRPDLLVSIFGIGLGIYLVAQGLGAFLEWRKLRKLGYGNVANLVMALAMLVLGTVQLCFPLGSVRWLVQVIGALLIVCGLASLVLRTSALSKLRKVGDVVDAEE